MGREYLDQLKKAMDWLGKQKNTFFLGQTVEYPGSPMHASLKDVPKEKKLELPLIEDDQMGMSIGLSLNGFIPISVYPRIDFLICAMNQLVNHLDKVETMSYGEFKPGVIIRTQIGNKEPIWPGVQHCGDYTSALDKMLENIRVLRIWSSQEIMWVYQYAYYLATKGKSTLIIEMPQGGSQKNFHNVKTEIKNGKSTSNN